MSRDSDQSAYTESVANRQIHTGLHILVPPAGGHKLYLIWNVDILQLLMNFTKLAIWEIT